MDFNQYVYNVLIFMRTNFLKIIYHTIHHISHSQTIFKLHHNSHIHISNY